MSEQLLEQGIGATQFEDLVGGQEWGQAFLPVIVAAFDLAFGLGGRGVAQGDAIEVERGAQLGEGVGVMGVEEGVVVDVEGQRQAVGLEGLGEEIQVGQEAFGWVEAGAGVVTGGVVQQVEQDLLMGCAGEKGVGRGVVLPECAVVAGLPAFNGLGWPFVASVRGQVVLERPATNTGAVGLEVEAAVQFTGGGTVGRGRFTGKEPGEQSARFGRPVGVMVPAGSARHPSGSKTLGIGAQVVGAELVQPTEMDIQFKGGGWR